MITTIHTGLTVYLTYLDDVKELINRYYCIPVTKDGVLTITYRLNLNDEAQEYIAKIANKLGYEKTEENQDDEFIELPEGFDIYKDF